MNSPVSDFEKLAPIVGRYVQVDTLEWAPFLKVSVRVRSAGSC